MGRCTEDGMIDDDCLENLKNGEPFFVLRAQDKVAAETVRLWCVLAGFVGSSKDKTNGAVEIAKAMEDWGKEHGTKVPD